MKHTPEAAEKFILSREFFGMKLGLENIGCFLKDIGSPQTAYDTIHISGTNGKGSTAAMLAAILQAAGYKTGLFTSPHLVSLRERVRVNNRMIPARSVTAFVDSYRKELSRRKLSFFEVVTALAFDHFRRARVDVAVIETGLGGRLDATNVLNPRLTITTDVGLDHTEILGTTLGRIALEKAGIVKPSTPHVIGMLAPEARDVFVDRCRDLRSRLYRLTQRDFGARSAEGGFDFRWNGCRIDDLRSSLTGPHQLLNSALAVKAVSILAKRGLTVPESAIREGLARTRWPGRFQVVRRHRCPVIVLDVCHNAGGVRALVDTFKQRFPERKAHVITGFVRRKPHQEMLGILSEIASDYALVPLKTKRSTDLAELTRELDFGSIPYSRFGSLATAYRQLLKASADDDIIVVTGSHFLVGEFFEKYGIR